MDQSESKNQKKKQNLILNQINVTIDSGYNFSFFLGKKKTKTSKAVNNCETI